MNTKNLVIIRSKMMINFISTHMKENPSLISLLVILPAILYFYFEITSPTGFEIYAVNPDLGMLFRSSNLIFLQVFYYTSLFAAPLYILMSQINMKSYDKYKNLNISFKDISLANLYSFLIIINIIIFLYLTLFLSHTASTLTASLFFMIIIAISIDLTIFILYLFYQIATNFLIKIIHIPYVSILEYIVIICTLSILYPIKYLPYMYVLIIPTYIVLLSLSLLTILIFILYTRIPLSNRYVLRNITKQNRGLKLTGDITIIKHYFLMITYFWKVYAEYIFTLIALEVFVKFLGDFEVGDTMLFQFLVPFFLISNGLIYANNRWYKLRKKEILNKMLCLDLIISLSILFLVCICISELVYQEILFFKIISICISYLLLNFLQRRLRLEYITDNKSPLLFIIFYGTGSFFINSLLDWLVSYV